jgi:hypothetical protein
MSKKTRKIHKRHVKRHRMHKRNRTQKRHTRRHLYRKRRQILSIPGSQGLPLFSKPVNKKSNRILINNNTMVSGNMIPGLRNM